MAAVDGEMFEVEIGLGLRLGMKMTTTERLLFDGADVVEKRLGNLKVAVLKEFVEGG